MITLTWPSDSNRRVSTYVINDSSEPFTVSTLAQYIRNTTGGNVYPATGYYYMGNSVRPSNYEFVERIVRTGEAPNSDDHRLWVEISGQNEYYSGTYHTLGAENMECRDMVIPVDIPIRQI